MAAFEELSLPYQHYHWRHQRLEGGSRHWLTSRIYCAINAVLHNKTPPSWRREISSRRHCQCISDVSDDGRWRDLIGADTEYDEVRQYIAQSACRDLSKVNKCSAYRLAFMPINGTSAVMSRSTLDQAILMVVQFVADALQNPRPNKRL